MSFLIKSNYRISQKNQFGKGEKNMHLKVKEVAELKSCSERYVRRMIEKGKIYAIEGLGKSNNTKEYSIPLDSLDEKLQKKYYAKIRKDNGFDVEETLDEKVESKAKTKKHRDINDLSESEMEELGTWISILKEWQSIRGKFEKVMDGDVKAIDNINKKLEEEGRKERVSLSILYRKYKYYKAEEYTGMLNDRGKFKNKNSIDEVVWQAFLYYYLDDRQPSMEKTYRDTIVWTKKFYPELVDNIKSYSTFRRKYQKEIPKVIDTMLRKGDKAMSDKCLDYIERLYDDLEVNECWVADNHTLDVITKYDDGSERTHRLSLTAFMDAKSGIITGWNLTDNPCSQSTVFALRMGIEKYGIPKSILFDNGREFTVKDVGGKGNRKRKSDEWHEVPPTMLQILGIEAHWAKVRNAKAKHIERFFLNFKNNISKNFESYAGGNILERPESLKRRIKNGEIIADSELRNLMETFIDFENCKEYGGAEKRKYKGFSKLDVWNSEIVNIKQRVASSDMLEKMLMRTSNYQKVSRKGVYLNISGEKIWYSEANSVFHLGKEVYLRYDPTDLSKVRLYDKGDRYFETWRVERELLLRFLDDDKEAVADANAKLQAQKKMVRDYAKGLTAGLSIETKIDQLALSVERAVQGTTGMEIKKGKIIEPVRFFDEIDETLEKTGTEDNIVKFDLDKMIKNAKKRKKDERGY